MGRSKKYWVKEIGTSWTNELKDILKTPYMDKLMDFIQVQYAMSTVYPKQKEDVFKTFKLTSWDDLKIVIINDTKDFDNKLTNNLLYGEHCIHPHPNSYVSEIRTFLEQEYDTILLDFDTSLESWAHQGILMLNPSLTTLEGDLKSHRRPWNKFIQFVVEHISKNKPSTIFLLWGDFGKSFSPKLSNTNHVFSSITPIEALKRKQNWKTKNFKDVNILLESITGEKESIRWCDFITKN